MMEEFMKLGDKLGDTKIRGAEKPVLSRFFVYNAFLLRTSNKGQQDCTGAESLGQFFLYRARPPGHPYKRLSVSEGL